MKLFESIINMFRGKKSFVNQFYDSGGSFADTYGAPTPENMAKYLGLYESEVWVYACTYIISNVIASSNWRTFKKKIVGTETEIVPVINNEFNQLIMKPNVNDSNSTFYDLIEWTAANTELSGNAFWLLNKSVNRKPTEIQMLPTANMRVVPGKSLSDPFVKEYKFISNDMKTISFAPEDVRHFKYMSPLNSFYGQGSPPSSRRSINIHKAAQESNWNRFVNGLPIGGTLETDQTLSEDKIKELQNKVISKFTGVNKSGIPMVLTGGLKYKDTLGTMKDLEYIEGLKINREEICAAFQVPPMLVGILDKATYSNYEQAVKIMMQFNIMPKLKRMQAVISTIAALFDPEMQFEFFVQEEYDEQKRAVVAKTYFDMGLPFNEINKRFNLGFPKIEGGDVGYLGFNLQPINMVGLVDQNAQQPAEEPEAEEPEEEEPEKSKNRGSILKGKTTYTKESKLLYAKKFGNFVNIIENRYMGIIEKFFLGLQISVLRKLMNKSKSIGKSDINVSMYLYDEEEAVKAWSKINKSVHAAALSNSGQMMIDNFGVDVMFNVRSLLVQKYLAENSLSKAELVIGHNREILATAISEGFGEGESIDAITKRIREVFAPYQNNGVAARRIAKTEVIGAANKGALEGIRQLDKTAKKFWLPGYRNTRDTHLEAGGKYSENNAIPLDEDFYVGNGSGPAPGSMDLAEEDVNCGCSLLPKVEA